MKSYKNDETLSGGSASRWYLNEDIPEVDDYFERLGDAFQKIQWISNGAEKFAATRNRGELPHKTLEELRDMDPWETESTDFLCTVTISKVMPDQPWWFQSCSKCHRSATSYGYEFRCTGGCISTKAYPKFRLCLEGTDGTSVAEFVFFNRVAQQLVGKSVMSLLRSSGLPREIAAVVSQKYTLAVSITQKSLSQRNISFQVNGIETFFGRQNSVAHDTRLPTVMPLLTANESSAEATPVASTDPGSAQKVPTLPIPPQPVLKKTTPQRVPIRNLKRKDTAPETANNTSVNSTTPLEPPAERTEHDTEQLSTESLKQTVVTTEDGANHEKRNMDGDLPSECETVSDDCGIIKKNKASADIPSGSGPPKLANSGNRKKGGVAAKGK